MMHRSLRSQHGFSLLELLVAFAIMAFSLGMLYQAIGSSARNVAETEVQQRAAALAVSLLSLRDGVPDTGWNEAGQSAGFNWRIQSAPYPTAVTNLNAPLLHEILITIAWNEGGRTGKIELTTLRPQRKPAPGEAIK